MVFYLPQTLLLYNSSIWRLLDPSYTNLTKPSFTAIWKDAFFKNGFILYISNLMSLEMSNLTASSQGSWLKFLIDWCCFYYSIRNSLEASLEALFARKKFDSKESPSHVTNREQKHQMPTNKEPHTRPLHRLQRIGKKERNKESLTPCHELWVETPNTHEQSAAHEASPWVLRHGAKVGKSHYVAKRVHTGAKQHEGKKELWFDLCTYAHT